MSTNGKSNIEVTADTRKARKSMGDFFRDIENTGKKALAVLSSINAFGNLQRDANRTSDELDALRDATRRLDSDLDNLGGDNNLDELSDDLNTTERNMNDVEDSTRDVDEALDDATNQMEEFGDTAVQESAAASSAVGGFWERLKTLKGAGEIFTGIGEGMQSVGKKLSMYVTAPFAALGGLAIAKGFSRLIGIDEAKAKLDGLGHSAESVEVIMNSALESVKGTSFGMDEAATTAANAVAAGIEKGEALTKYLSLTGDAAAIAGDSLSGMGAIFNKVQTSGKAYNGELQQLSDRGLPIYQWLAKEAGVAADAVFDMASKGEISTEMFLAAVENNIGGAAQAMGAKSFKAGIDNMWAAVGRLGAKFLDAGGEGGGFFSKIKPLIGEMTENIDSLGDYAQNLGEKFGAAFSVVIEKARGVIDWFKGLSDAGKKLAGMFAVAAVAAGPILTFLSVFVIGAGKVMTALAPLAAKVKNAGGLMKYLRGVFVAFTGPVGLTIAAIVTLGSAFIAAYKKSDTFRKGVGKVIDFVKDVFAKVKEFGEGVKGLFKDDGQKGRDILTAMGIPPEIVQKMDDVAERIAEFRGKIIDFVDGVKGLFVDDGSKGRDLLSSVGLPDSLIGKLDAWAQNLSAFRHHFEEFIGAIRTMFSGDMASGKDILQRLGFTDNFIGKAETIVGKLQEVGAVIKDVFVKSLPVVKSAVSAVFSFIAEQFAKISDFFKSEGPQLLAAFKNAFDGIVNIAKFLGIVVIGAFKGIWEFIKFIMPGILAVIKSVWGNIKGIITGALDVIMGVVKIFSGLFTGDFKKMWEGVKQLFSGAVKLIFNLIALSLLGRLTKVAILFIASFAGIFIRLKDAVVKIFNDLVNGVKEKWKSFDKMSRDASSAIRDGVSKIFTSLSDKTKEIFNGIRDFFKGIWDSIYNAIAPKVQKIWDFIKPIWEGIAELTTAIFTGIRNFFSVIWSAISQIFVNVGKAIVGIVLELWDKVYKYTSDKFNAVYKFFSVIWDRIKAIFSAALSILLKTVRDKWQETSDATTSKFTAIKDFFSRIWSVIKRIFTDRINEILNFLRPAWDAISSKTTAVFNAIRDFLSRIWSNIQETVGKFVTVIRNRVSGAWDSVLTKTKTVFKSVFDAVKGRFDDIVDAAKKLPQRIGDGMKNMAGKVSAGINSVVNKMGSGLENGVNGVIKGINQTLNALNVSTRIEPISIPRYAHGTDAHPGGLALVNDGVGTNAGPEMIIQPNGAAGMFKGKNVIGNFEKGTQVISAINTRKLLTSIPAYAAGKGLFNKVLNKGKAVTSYVWDEIKGTGNKVKGLALDVFDYLKNPSGLLDVALKSLGVERPSGKSIPASIVKGGWDKVRSGAVEFIKGKLAEFGDQKGQGFGSAFRKTSSFGTRIHPITGLRETHWGDDWGAKQGTLIPAQAAGQVIQSAYHALRGNYIRIKSGIMERIYQHNQRNLVGVGDTVSKGQGIGTVGSTGRSTGPHLHYEVLKNGKHINPMGYFKGGIVKAKQLAWVAEKGMEAIIPLVTNRSEGLDLWRRVGEHFGFNMEALLNPAEHNVSFAGNGMEQMQNMSDVGSRLSKTFQPAAAGTSQAKQPVIIQTILPSGRIMAEEYIEDFNAEDLRRKKMKKPNKGGRLV